MDLHLLASFKLDVENILNQEHGETSVSHLVTELKYLGWKLGNDFDFTEAGFKMTPVYQKKNPKLLRMTLVSLQ